MLTAAFLAAAVPVTQIGLSAPVAGQVAAPDQRSRTVRLTAAEMFVLAERAASSGNPDAAGAILEALEQDRDPDVRAEARFRRAKQLIQKNRTTDAAVLLRRILDEKPNATGVRLELAKLLHQLGDLDLALRELRAAQAAGLPPAVARLVDRYSEALRASRPMGASLEIAIAPDSNINRATRSDTLDTIFGDFEIDEGGKAKSGTGIALRGQAFRRMALRDGNYSILARASSFADLYRDSRFNEIAVDAAVGPEMLIGRNRVNVEIGATTRWFGQQPFVRAGRIGASWIRPLGSRTQVRLSGSAAVVDNRVNDLQDGKVYSGRLELERALMPTFGVALNLGLDRQDLKDAGYSTRGWRAGLLAWKDLGRTTLTAGGEIGRLKADERLILFPEKRSDRYRRFTLSASFRQLGFAGFAPVARFTMERNRSSIEFYDYSRTRSELGIVKAF